jgi:dihydroorotase
VKAALDYRDRLQPLAPDVTFLMTLYLHQSITPATIAEAAQAGIVGVKAYPAGVTTNSEGGVIGFQSFYPVFEAMQEHGLVLNLHGEVPNTAPRDLLTTSTEDVVSVLNAEHRFLPTLHKLHTDFPR